MSNVLYICIYSNLLLKVVLLKTLTFKHNRVYKVISCKLKLCLVDDRFIEMQRMDCEREI